MSIIEDMKNNINKLKKIVGNGVGNDDITSAIRKLNNKVNCIDINVKGLNNSVEKIRERESQIDVPLFHNGNYILGLKNKQYIYGLVANGKVVLPSPINNLKIELYVNNYSRLNTIEFIKERGINKKFNIEQGTYKFDITYLANEWIITYVKSDLNKDYLKNMLLYYSVYNVCDDNNGEIKDYSGNGNDIINNDTVKIFYTQRNSLYNNYICSYLAYYVKGVDKTKNNYSELNNDVTLNNFSLFLVCHPKECTGSNTTNQQFGFGDVNNNISIRTTNATTNNLIIEVTTKTSAEATAKVLTYTLTLDASKPITLGFSFDKGIAKIYKDGILVTSKEDMDNVSFGKKIGLGDGFNTNFTTGNVFRLSKMVIVNNTLTQEEFQDMQLDLK